MRIGRLNGPFIWKVPGVAQIIFRLLPREFFHRFPTIWLRYDRILLTWPGWYQNPKTIPLFRKVR